MSAAFTAILALIQQLLPVLGGSDATLIASIINVLEKWVPLIITGVEELYQPVKNIIAALSANPAITADQLVTLQSLDAQVDAAFESIAVQVDPDAVPAA